MKRQLHLADLRSMIGRALGQGAIRTSHIGFEWDIAGNCTAPHITELYARPDGYRRPKMRLVVTESPELDGEGNILFTGRLEGARRGVNKHVTIGPGTEHSLALVLHTRCRKCLNCRKVRASLWRLRAAAETRSAPRTWFATLTLSPEQQERARWVACDRMAKIGKDFDALDRQHQFIELVSAINPAITRWLKRVRKSYPAKFRYLMVAEEHKSGLPHFHALIHQMDPNAALTKRALQLQWGLGFSQFKLVENVDAASYLCKYLTKSAAARVRASQAYGREIDYEIERTKHHLDDSWPPASVEKQRPTKKLPVSAA